MNTSTTTCLTLEQPDLERHDSLIDLVNAARAGDQEAWNALVDRFLPLVTSVIAKYRLQASDADDVNQTVWLRLVEHLDDLREPRALPGWLATITRNESVHVIRLRGRATPVDPHWAPWERPDHRPELDNDLICEERAIALREAMLELAPQCRELLRLLMVDPPMSYDQISVMLGSPKEASVRHAHASWPCCAPIGRSRTWQPPAKSMTSIGAGTEASSRDAQSPSMLASPRRAGEGGRSAWRGATPPRQRSGHFTAQRDLGLLVAIIAGAVVDPEKSRNSRQPFNP